MRSAWAVMLEDTLRRGAAVASEEGCSIAAREALLPACLLVVIPLLTVLVTAHSANGDGRAPCAMGALVVEAGGA